MTHPLDQAVSILRRGGLVAFPTETVYGLGADATRPAAVRRVFVVKGRPPTNPLIVHVADAAAARRCASHWPDLAEELARRFWPGPLTLIVGRAATLAPEVGAGLPTVGLRAPDHPLALELLRRFDGPIAAPSANRSARLSPTTAEHVRSDLGDEVDLILDGGPCRVGIESTVLDVSGPKPRILRPGGIARTILEAAIGPVELDAACASPDAPSPSPGRQSVHYAPTTPAVRFETGRMPPPPADVAVLRAGDDPQAFARDLYAELRRLDAQGKREIWIEMPPDSPEWEAVRDRIIRATRPAPR